MRFSGWDRVAAFGCGIQLVSITWDFQPPSPAPYGTLCNYPPAIGAWAICVTQVIDEHIEGSSHADMLSRSVDWANFVCLKAGGGASPIGPEDFLRARDNATHFLKPIPPNHQSKVAFPVLLDEWSRNRTIHAVHAEFSNLDNSNDKALWLYYYFAAVFMGLFACTFVGIRKKLIGSSFLNRLRARFILPTVWLTESHANHSPWALGGLFPTSLEALLLSGLVLVHTYALCADYSIDDNEVMETAFEQFLQGLGNRSGILAFAMLPLIIVFSARCQLLQTLLGLRYTTVLVFHRWLGRFMMIDSVIHSIAFYYHSKLVNELQMQAHSWFWITGIAATVLTCVMIVWGTGAIRRRWYEIFLVSHITLALLFFYLCWQHVVMFGWTYWVWISLFLWAAERCYRLFVIYKNGCVNEATLTPLSKNLMAITIPKPLNWHSFPSHYAYIYFLHPRFFWQSHPFTVSDMGNELRVVVSVKTGVTKQIYELAKAKSSANDGDSLAKIPVLLEGPYGQESDPMNFDRALLFAGGSGVPGPLAIAEKCPNARLVLTVRDMDILHAYHDQIDALKVPMEIYITRSDYSSDLRVYKGRPNILEIVDDFVTELASMGASGAVVCCGPPALNDKVRNSVAASLKKLPQTSLEYIEEFQVW